MWPWLLVYGFGLLGLLFRRWWVVFPGAVGPGDTHGVTTGEAGRVVGTLAKKGVGLLCSHFDDRAGLAIC